MAVPLPVLAGQNTGEKLVALLAYASIEEYGPLFDAEFHYYYQQLKAMHDNGWIFEEAAKKEFGTGGHSPVYGYKGIIQTDRRGVGRCNLFLRSGTY